MADLNEKVKLFNAIQENLTLIEKKNWKDKFAIEFTHNSTAIEGNTCSLIETKMILEDEIAPAEKKLKEIDEIRNHYHAFQYIQEKALTKQELTEEIIKDIHERVLPMPGVGGLYRLDNVYIKGAQHVPPNYKKVRDFMKFFADDIKTSKANVIEKAAWIHAEFVKIHPFIDGNGRTARLMMNYHLMSNEYPPTIIKKGNVTEYFQSLENYALKGNISDFSNLLKKNINKELDEFIEMYGYHLEKTEDTAISQKYDQISSASGIQELEKNCTPEQAYNAYAKDLIEKYGSLANSDDLIARAMLKDGREKVFVEKSLATSPNYITLNRTIAVLNAKSLVKTVLQQPDMKIYKNSLSR